MRWAILIVAMCACEKAETGPPGPPTPTPTPTPIPIPTPRPVPRDAGTVITKSACDVVVVSVGMDGLWLGAPPDVRCYAARTPGGVDGAWLAAELRKFRTVIDPKCKSMLLLGAAPDVIYADVVTIMEACRQAGFPDIVFTLSTDLPVSFAGVSPASVPHCATPIVVPPAPVPDTPPTPAPDLPAPRFITGDTVSVVVSPTAIWVRGKQVVLVSAIAKAGPIPELTAALGKPTADARVIVEADRRVDAALVQRVIQVVRDAGFRKLGLATQPP